MPTTWQERGHVAVLVAAVVLFPVQTTLLATRHDLMVGFGLLVTLAHVGSVPLALVRPVPAAGLSLVAVTVQAVVMMPQDVGGWPWAVPPQIITQLLVLVVLTAVSGWRLAAGTLAVQLAAGVVLAVLGLWWHDLNSSLGFVALFAGIAVPMVALGVALARLAESRAALQRERTISADEHARRTVVEEKSRIARELHDVIAHNMSLITVQARSAPHRVDAVSPAAAAEFDQLADLAAEALRQMRGVLDVLRTEPGQSGLAPVPHLEDLDELFASARSTGQNVDVVGSPPATERVPAEVGATVYRIVQEALSNARRHAPTAHVQVTLESDDAELRVRVVNALSSPAEESTEGHGVVGMRERAESVGGSLTVDVSSPSEYVVDARLPVHPESGSVTVES